MAKVEATTKRQKFSIEEEKVEAARIFIFPWLFSSLRHLPTHNNMCQPKRYERNERFIYSFVRVSDMIYGNRREREQRKEK